ncbi:fumble-domain-containing protein [Absidia repens]|uniref:pantothenate kinase n=1 Tax=Absidia repens TaxID=90262 RepID=A0A1X2I2W5_9FUNG|nr:fumble-domain-containing protein [Absidia repens]
MNMIGASVSEASLDAAHETRDIVLPNQNEHVAQIAVDIGGSLAKIVYFTSSTVHGGRLHFKKFETEKIDQCIEFISELVKDAQQGQRRRRLSEQLQQPLQQRHHHSMMVLKATGGGAHLYYDKLKSKLPGVQVQKEDEMDCLITGLNFFISEIPYEAFTYDEQEINPMQFEKMNAKDEIYPYILVNIGSGVSLLKVTGPDEFSRISGTSLGGGTLWGLLSILTKASSFDEMLEMSVKGDNRNVDLLVGDIYGADYTKLGLKSTRIASSFGKVFKKGQHPTQGQFQETDMAKSLLYMVSNNIGQIAYLNAEQHNIKRIYFGGSLFLRHEGHLGATGAFLKYHPIRKARHSFSFSENFQPDITSNSPSRVYGVLEETNVELKSPEDLDVDNNDENDDSDEMMENE